jgi:hypothetical protein
VEKVMTDLNPPEWEGEFVHISHWRKARV